MLTLEFFKQFDPVSEDLENRLRMITIKEGTSLEVQRRKIDLLVKEAGLSAKVARQYLNVIMREPDDKGMMADY